MFLHKVFVGQQEQQRGRIKVAVKDTPLLISQLIQDAAAAGHNKNACGDQHTADTGGQHTRANTNPQPPRSSHLAGAQLHVIVEVEHLVERQGGQQPVVDGCVDAHVLVPACDAGPACALFFCLDRHRVWWQRKGEWRQEAHTVRLRMRQCKAETPSHNLS